MTETELICPSCMAENPGDAKICDFCHTPLISSMYGIYKTTVGHRVDHSLPLVKNDFIANRYEVIQLLGQGGMGAVYLVKDHVLQARQIALKMISPDLLQDDYAHQLFVQEVLATQSLTHENIVKVFHFDRVGGQDFFTMEYLSGKNLREVIDSRGRDGGRFDLAEIGEIVLPILSALDHAHGKGVIHRDLKPENIIIQGTFPGINVKVLDFGLAKITAPERMSFTAQEMGTAYYMAPEQLSGRAKVDKRSDLYAIGVILYELLTGRVPAGVFDMPSVFMQGHEKEMDSIIKHLLSRRPDGRYDCADSCRKALQPLINEREEKTREIIVPIKKDLARALFAKVEEGLARISDQLPEKELMALTHSYEQSKAEYTAAMNKGEAMLRQNRISEATQCFDTALEYCPEARKALYHLESIAHKKEAPHVPGNAEGMPGNAERIQKKQKIKTGKNTVRHKAIFFGRRLMEKSGSNIVVMMKEGASYFKNFQETYLNKTKGQLIKNIESQLVYIPPGIFMMGCASSLAGSKNNALLHQVTLSRGVYMQSMPVSQEQWKELMGENPSRFSDSPAGCPVEQVSWDDAQAFIKRLNQKEGAKKYRLPTEAEWEYACRAGTDKDRYGDIDSIAWYCDNCDEKTHPVGQKQPNAWGLYDMLGNVYEWCQDWYEDYLPEAVTDPIGPMFGLYRVRRGGSWRDTADACKAFHRAGSRCALKDNYIGFRLVRDI